MSSVASDEGGCWAGWGRGTSRGRGWRVLAVTAVQAMQSVHALLAVQAKGWRGWRRRWERVLLQGGMEGVRRFVRDPGNEGPRMGVEARGQGLIRRFGSYRYHEPQEHHLVSEQPMVVDSQAIKALGCWL